MRWLQKYWIFSVVHVLLLTKPAYAEGTGVAAPALSSGSESGSSEQPKTEGGAPAVAAPSRLPIELSLRFATYYDYGWFANLYHHPNWGIRAHGPSFQVLFPVASKIISEFQNPLYIGIFAEYLIHPKIEHDYTNLLMSITGGVLFQWRFVLDMGEWAKKALKMHNFSVFVSTGAIIWPWFVNNTYCDNCAVVLYGTPIFEFGVNWFFNKRIGLSLLTGYPSTRLGLSLAI